MSELVTLDNTGGSKLPAHLAKALKGQEKSSLSANVGAGGFDVISIKGKRWAITSDGARETVMRPDDPDEPASSLEVIIVAANPNISKVHYTGGYTEGSDSKPTCFSNNGIIPSDESEVKQAAKCALCKHNQWGSRIAENGAKGKACSDSRRIVVVPVGEPDRPMLLRIPANTLRDLAKYGDSLHKRNAPFDGVVTKLTFDNDVAYPKLKFRASRWTTEDEYRQVRELLESEGEKLDQMTGVSTAVIEGAAVHEEEVSDAGAAKRVEASLPEKEDTKKKKAAKKDEVDPPAKESVKESKQQETEELPPAVKKATEELDNMLDGLDFDD